MCEKKNDTLFGIFARSINCDVLTGLSCSVTGSCGVVRRLDANTSTTEHSLCAIQYLITVELVEHSKAETDVHFDVEQRLNLRTSLLCCVIIPE